MAGFRRGCKRFGKIGVFSISQVWKIGQLIPVAARRRLMIMAQLVLSIVEEFMGFFVYAAT
jgi:hypothetical protein